VTVTLSAPPRAVPFALRLSFLTWSWWVAWSLFMVAIAPIWLWHYLWDRYQPGVPIAAAATVAVIIVVRSHGTWRRNALLRHGVVADVVGATTIRQGTYYSGLTYTNQIVPQAHGWDVERRLSSGPATTTAIRYHVGDTASELRLRGRPYVDGVILADARKPHRALCVSSFPFDLRRNDQGDWVGNPGLRVVIGSIAMSFLLGGWIAATAVLVMRAR
jgi:hypothetical protein